MEKNIEAKIEQAEKKLHKKIEAILWKAGYAASKPIGVSGMSEGYNVTTWKGLAFINYNTDKGQQRKIQMLTKYRDALCEQGWQADIDNPENLGNSYRRELHTQAVQANAHDNMEDLCIYVCDTLDPDIDFFW